MYPCRALRTDTNDYGTEITDFKDKFHVMGHYGFSNQLLVWVRMQSASMN
jgi:hypothetical protein